MWGGPPLHTVCWASHATHLIMPDDGLLRSHRRHETCVHVAHRLFSSIMAECSYSESTYAQKSWSTEEWQLWWSWIQRQTHREMNNIWREAWRAGPVKHTLKRDTLVRDSYFRLIRGVSRRICFSSSPERGLPSKACVLLWRLAGGP